MKKISTVMEYVKNNFLRLLILFCVMVMVFFVAVYAFTPKFAVGIGSEWWYSVRSGGQARVEPLIYDELVRLVGIELCGLTLCYKLKIENPFYIKFDYILDEGVLIKTVLHEKETGAKYIVEYNPPLRFMPAKKEFGESSMSHTSAVVSIDSPTEGLQREQLAIDFFAKASGRDSFLIGDILYDAVVITEEVNGRLVRRVWLIEGVMYPLRYELPESASWGYMTSFKQTDNSLDFLQVSIAAPLEVWHLAVVTAVLYFLEVSSRKFVKNDIKGKSFWQELLEVDQ